MLNWPIIILAVCIYGGRDNMSILPSLAAPDQEADTARLNIAGDLT